MTEITAKTKVLEVEGTIVPLQTGTRTRVQASTYSTVISSYGTSNRIEVSSMIEYLETDVALPHIWKGDKWGVVKSIDNVLVTKPTFMAIFYHDAPICTENFQIVIPSDPDPTPEPEIIYPDIVLVGPEGKQKKYIPEG